MGLVRSSAATRGRSEAQGEVARDTKQLAGELDTAILALVQLSRKVEERDDKRPMLSDLRDSGEWEENADGVIGCYREAYYAQREPEPKRRDLKLLWDERRESRIVDAMFLKIREGEARTVHLWADMGRNAIRGEAPASHYGGGANLGRLPDLLDPDVALPRYEPGEFA
jgi:replicative DNA helicase